MNLGTRLQHARELAGLSESQAVKLLGISRNDLAKYEKGESEPDEAMITKMVNIYGCNREWLTTGVNSRFDERRFLHWCQDHRIGVDDSFRLTDLMIVIAESNGET